MWNGVRPGCQQTECYHNKSDVIIHGNKMLIRPRGRQLGICSPIEGHNLYKFVMHGYRTDIMAWHVVKILCDLDSVDFENKCILKAIAAVRLIDALTAASYTSFSSVSVCVVQVWEFSSLFSSVDRWSFSNTPSMSDHLKTCSFYQREEHTDPVALVCLGEIGDKHKEVKHKR